MADRPDERHCDRSRHIRSGRDNGTARKSYVLYGLDSGRPQRSSDMVAGPLLSPAMVALGRGRHDVSNPLRLPRNVVDDSPLRSLRPIGSIRIHTLEKERTLSLASFSVSTHRTPSVNRPELRMGPFCLAASSVKTHELRMGKLQQLRSQR